MLWTCERAKLVQEARMLEAASTLVSKASTIGNSGTAADLAGLFAISGYSGKAAGRFSEGF